MCDKIIVSHKGGFAVRNIITRLNIKEYKDRVYACWLGKNIGGTIGGPYEGSEEFVWATARGDGEGRDCEFDARARERGFGARARKRDFEKNNGVAKN